MSKVICHICPHACVLEQGQTGLCRARSNLSGQVRSINYGLITSMALDPIEKKPLKRFYPGSKILSVGSFGCNLACPFCQNYSISMAGSAQANSTYISPEVLVRSAASARERGNIGIAFTYNEPLVGFEYVYDSCVKAKRQNLESVLVTNGYINPAPLEKLLGYVSAMNIDLKGYSEAFYQGIGGDLNTVRQTILSSAERCHVEITTLIIPGQNDSEEEMTALSDWLASVSPEIPLHISRFFPNYKMCDRQATPKSTIISLAVIARRRLHYVYTGNM